MADFVFRIPLFARLPDPRPTAVEFVAAPPLALLQPVPGQPFANFDWPCPPGPLPKAAGESYGSPQALIRTAPFGPLHFHVVNLQKPAPPKIPGITTLPPLTPLYFPLPIQPFAQDIWDSAAKTPPKAIGESDGRVLPPTVKYVLRSPTFVTPPAPPAPQKSDAYGSPDSLMTAAPAAPFRQLDWPSTARITLSPKSDVYSGELTLYTNQVSIGQPESLDIWDSPARAPLSLKSDVFSGPATLYGAQINLGQPTSQDLWPRPAAPLAKAVGEPVAGDLPLLTAAPLTQPSGEDLWPAAARGPLPQKSDVYDSPDSLTRANPFRPPHQEAATRGPLPQKSDVYDSPDPLTRPNPARPLVQSDWFQVRTTQKARVDDPIDTSNLLSPARQIIQTDWPNPTLPRIKIGGDFSVPGIRALYGPNPSRPFTQTDWVLPTRGRALPQSSDWWPGALTTPIPPPFTGLPHSRPLLAVMGGMTVIQGDT